MTSVVVMLLCECEGEDYREVIVQFDSQKHLDRLENTGFDMIINELGTAIFKKYGPGLIIDGSIEIQRVKVEKDAVIDLVLVDK